MSPLDWTAAATTLQLSVPFSTILAWLVYRKLLAAGLAVFLAAVSLKEPLTLNIVVGGAVTITITAMIQFLKPRRKQKGKV